MVTLRVTKVGPENMWRVNEQSSMRGDGCMHQVDAWIIIPRRGLSWLNKIPFTANIP